MKSAIERAAELASSGSYSSVGAIREQLVREGYTHVDAHIGGSLSRRQLSARIKAARAKPEPISTNIEGNDA